jgi:hypothetical protein
MKQSINLSQFRDAFQRMDRATAQLFITKVSN